MPAFQFVKSSHSTGDGECVEVAVNVPGVVAVRDSKDPDGPQIWCSPAQWSAFRRAVLRGETARG